MRKGFVLYRWFRNVSIARKLYFVIGTMAVLIGVELFVLLFCLHTLSSLRAYVGGEGLWSKAEKDAVFHLYKYGVSRSEDDYDQFQHFMQVPIGDARTRQELLKPKRNLDVAREGFLAGRNHPDDIDGMITLFTRFSDVFYIRKAITIWGDAQSNAMQLLPIAAALHQEINSPQPSQARIDTLLASVNTLNDKLTALEDEFSFTLGEGSRWLERVVLRLLFIMALSVETTGLLLAVSVTRGMQRGLRTIIQAAQAFSAGELGARSKVFSGDEIGVVAGSFNAMADSLQVRIGELAALNQHLSHEIDERKRAEVELRGAFVQLEAAHDALKCEIAERLRAEEMLRQSEKMKALGQLTGGIAHDFNNLLGVIIGCSECLMEAVRDDPEQTDLAHEILTNALNGSLLTRRLLAVARNQPLRPQHVDLSILLVDLVEILRRTLGEAIRIAVIEAPHLWYIGADPSQISDALLNLALNARDAMPQGGDLTIEAANVHLDAQGAAAYSELNPGDYVALSVTDTGTGMPEDVLQRAIEPFFSTKPPTSGSGLGLSMAYGFAKQSGGHLDIASAIGIGTKVRLHLPRASNDAAPVAQAPKAAAPDPRGTEAILLVDDNKTLLEMARRHLDALGYAVMTAPHGPAALDILRSCETIDLLFTDIVMPEGMSGYKLAAAALELRPELKVLYTTGYAGELSEHSGQHVLFKPYDRHDLARAVRAALDELPVTA